MSNYKIVLQVSGSIAAYKAAALASLMIKEGYQLKVILTDAARKFIGDATFYGITKEFVLPNTMFNNTTVHPHIDLAIWADMILLYPASANTINRLAVGMSNDLIGALFLANNFRKKYIIAPAMNEQMLINPITQESLKKLIHLGVMVADTETGRLACGIEGKGRLIEPSEMFQLIKENL